jgi:hypothetical protein
LQSRDPDNIFAKNTKNSIATTHDCFLAKPGSTQNNCIYTKKKFIIHYYTTSNFTVALVVALVVALLVALVVALKGAWHNM